MGIERWEPLNVPADVNSNNNHLGPVDVDGDDLDALLRQKHNQGSLQHEDTSVLGEEMKRYEAKPKVEKTVDICDWWSKQEDLPTLRKVAREILCIPASSSKSERVFSTSGKVCNDRRMRLKPSMVEDLTIMTENEDILCSLI